MKSRIQSKSRREPPLLPMLLPGVSLVPVGRQPLHSFGSVTSITDAVSPVAGRRYPEPHMRFWSQLCHSPWRHPVQKGVSQRSALQCAFLQHLLLAPLLATLTSNLGYEIWNVIGVVNFEYWRLLCFCVLRELWKAPWVQFWVRIEGYSLAHFF